MSDQHADYERSPFYGMPLCEHRIQFDCHQCKPVSAWPVTEDDASEPPVTPDDAPGQAGEHLRRPRRRR